jgi:hypothetical protein
MEENPARTERINAPPNRRGQPWPLLVVYAIVIGLVALPKMKLSGWIILGLFVALIVAIVAFVVRCVRLYRGRHAATKSDAPPPG